MKCYYCCEKNYNPEYSVNIIGLDKEKFNLNKSDFNFCKKCFERFFGYPKFDKTSYTCYICENPNFVSLPYSYLEYYNVILRQATKVRICGDCSVVELFPILRYLLIKKT